MKTTTTTTARGRAAIAAARAAAAALRPNKKSAKQRHRSELIRAYKAKDFQEFVVRGFEDEHWVRHFNRLLNNNMTLRKSAGFAQPLTRTNQVNRANYGLNRGNMGAYRARVYSPYGQVIHKAFHRIVK